jgi:hypothetical protein
VNEDEQCCTFTSPHSLRFNIRPILYASVTSVVSADAFNFLEDINIIQKVLDVLLAASEEDSLEVNREN